MSPGWRPCRWRSHTKRPSAIFPDAYETLLYDVMTGDRTLFVRSDEVEQAWRLYTPILEAGIRPVPYPAGSWGPPEADSLVGPYADSWTVRLPGDPGPDGF